MIEEKGGNPDIWAGDFGEIENLIKFSLYYRKI